MLPEATPEAMAAEIASRNWDVPGFRAEVLQPRKSRYVIIIPVINEGERIQRQLRAMAALHIADEIDTGVVDGGSSDGSLERDFLASVGVRALVTKTGPGFRAIALWLCLGAAGRLSGHHHHRRQWQGWRGYAAAVCQGAG